MTARPQVATARIKPISVAVTPRDLSQTGQKGSKTPITRKIAP